MTNFPVFNGPARSDGKPWFTFRNNADESKPVEILIYDQIGKDWWDGSGIGTRDFAEELKKIPTNRSILLCVNSPGGNVHDGLAIYNQLKLRRDKITARIDGIAASTASWLVLAAGEVQMPRNALFMIHDPMSIAIGNADEMRKAAEILDQHKGVIANIYEEATAQPRAVIDEKMREETWFDGDTAKEFGFVDTLLDDLPALANSFDLSRFRRVPEILKSPKNAVPKNGRQPNEIMNRTEIIALLKEHGVQVEDSATDDQLKAKLKEVLNKKPEQPKTETKPEVKNETKVEDSKIVSIQSELEAIRKERDAERRKNVANRVDGYVTDGRIPANARDKWIELAVKNGEEVLDSIAALPVPEPTENLPRIEITNASPQDIQNHVLKNLSTKDGMSPEKKAETNLSRARFLDEKTVNRIISVWNTNTIGADLKRAVLLQKAVRDFAKILFPLRAFTTVHSNVPLEGTNEVVVPYYALDTSATTDFVAANGYNTFGNTSTSSKKITVNKRKYQGMSWTSDELRRQPFLNLATLMGLKVEKLGEDIFTDVLSVVTAANFGAASFTGAASTFDSDDVVDLDKVATDTHWPQSGRSLFVATAYNANLLKDTSIKNSLNYGGSEAIREARIPKIFNFDYYSSAMIPANAENLVGFIAFMSAILVATSPIEPTPEVRSQLAAYMTAVDAETGIALEYRRWGSASLDTSYETVEANYGYLTGIAAALKRLVSA